MDPLSITVSTVTLIQAAGAVFSTLSEFAKTFRNADSRVEALSSQLSKLIKRLEAVDRTLRNCRERLSLASMDDDLWCQSALSLEDCKTTLDELAIFVNRVKAVAKSPGLFRRVKVATDLTMYAVDISRFEEKIYKSNSAVQTMLSAIQLALSLRGNETQDQILLELANLTAAIDQVMQASFHHSDSFSRILQDPSDARVNHNLQKLARAAQNFHSSASSTASTRESSSTISGPNRASFWNIPSEAAMSIVGGPSLTPNKRRQVNQFVKQQRRMTQRRKRKPLQHVPSSTADPNPAVSSEESQETESNVSEEADDNDERDDEVDDLELFLLSGHDEVAKDSMLNEEFAKAQSHLERAIQSRTGSTSEDSDFKKLQIQLAICNFFQHQWQLAEPLIESIAKSKANFDPVVCNLLHALAIANLLEKRFEKAVAACKQALAGKRRLKPEFAVTFETECNETLGLLATIHAFNDEPVLAEATRRKISKGFFYHHPENELEFIVNHPKLCMEVLGKKIVLDWRRPREPAELFAALPSRTLLAPIQEMMEDTLQNSKTAKKPLQTFHTKLSLYDRLNTDSAKEVVGSSSPSASGSEDDFGSSWNNASGGPSYLQGINPKPSFTRRVVRFFGTRRERAARSGDNWSTRPSSGTEDMSSPSRPRFGKGFWSKSDGKIFKLKKSKVKLHKRASDDADSNTFSSLSTVGRQRLVATWLPRSADSTPSNFCSSSSWVPASQILEEMEEQRRPAELADTSIVRCWSENITRPPNAPFPTTLGRFATVKDDCCEGCEGCEGCEDRGRESAKSQSGTVRESHCPPGSTARKQKLTVTIPKFGERLESIPLVAHQPAKRCMASSVDITKSTEPRSTPSGSSGSSLATTSTKTEIITKVLNDFNSDDTDEQAVKERLERDFDESMQKKSQGLWVGESGGRQAWVPASHFKDLSPIPTTVGSSVDRISQDLQTRDDPVRETTPLANRESEIDVFSRPFHKAIAHFTRKEEPRSDPPKPRYQLVDGVVEKSPKSPTKLGRARKRPSLPKLPAIDESQSSEQETPVQETQADSESTSPSLPPQQLGRKFSWETVFEENNLSAIPMRADPEPSPSPESQLKLLTRKFSWVSDDHPGTPDLVRSSSLSSSSSSSTSSTSSATSATSPSSTTPTSSGPVLKYDPIEKDLIFVSNDSTSSLPETQSLDDFLKQLSVSILKRKSKRSSAKNLSPLPKLDVELKARQHDEPASASTKDKDEPEPSVVQANLEPNALPVLRPTDISLRDLEEEAREKEKNANSDPTEGILNRRHPLREKRRRRRGKTAEGNVRFLDEEKRLLYPGCVSSLGALSIGIAI